MSPNYISRDIDLPHVALQMSELGHIYSLVSQKFCNPAQVRKLTHLRMFCRLSESGPI